MIEIKGYSQLNKILWEQKDSDKVMMLYFSTSWCGPCKKLKERIEDEKDKIELVEVLLIDCDLEDNEEIVEDWKIDCLPTQIFVHLEDKNVVKDDRIEGFDWIKLIMSYEKIIENRNDYLNIDVPNEFDKKGEQI